MMSSDSINNIVNFQVFTVNSKVDTLKESFPKTKHSHPNVIAKPAKNKLMQSQL